MLKIEVTKGMSRIERNGESDLEFALLAGVAVRALTKAIVSLDNPLAGFIYKDVIGNKDGELEMHEVNTEDPEEMENFNAMFKLAEGVVYENEHKQD